MRINLLGNETLRKKSIEATDEKVMYILHNTVIYYVECRKW
ncbi:hypothetical protein [Clostridium weizhouense]|nr:hypothetical protein [Clostridium weizhouense]